MNEAYVLRRKTNGDFLSNIEPTEWTPFLYQAKMFPKLYIIGMGWGPHGVRVASTKIWYDVKKVELK